MRLAQLDALGLATGFVGVPGPLTRKHEAVFFGVPKLAGVVEDEAKPLLYSKETIDPTSKLQMKILVDAFADYNDRLRVLREQAVLDGFFINHGSLEGFKEFFKNNPLIRRGRLVLLENGNLRAVWKGEEEAHVGLQFLDKWTVQYVIFARRHPSAVTSRVTGTDTIQGVIRQIKAFDLANLVYA